MMLVVTIISYTIFGYLLVSVLYALIFSVAGRVGKIKEDGPTGIYRRYAVLIPCYKEDELILQTSIMALEQTYPKDKFDVVVIADSLKKETILKLQSFPIKVVEVSFEKSTKAKSINKALEVLPEVYDYALVLDADNIMEPEFIEKVNAKFVRTNVGAVQGHRVAKNLNTNFAVLDAISEEVNNHIYRKGHRVLGLSSGLIGSGMAFDYSYFKEVMATNHAIGGFDKELELKLLRDGVTIEYVENAYIYDEKVENAQVFQNQRKRWISAQIHYFKKYFFQGIWHLITYKNVDFFDKAFQQFLLPRVLLLGTISLITSIAMVLNYIFNIALPINAHTWLILLFFNLSGIVLAIPEIYFNKRTLNAALTLPKAIGVMFLTLFKLRGANKTFIHTPHSGKMDALDPNSKN